jgi:hypothetical protein
MTLDDTEPGKVKILMFHSIEEILAAFKQVAEPKASGVKSSAALDNIFKVNPEFEKLDSHKAQVLHHLVAQTLLHHQVCFFRHDYSYRFPYHSGEGS